MEKLIIYTDGACSGNPGNGGWGAIIRYKNIIKEMSGSESRTTNNRMELLAIIKSIASLKESMEIDLYSDSKYIVNSINKGWLKKWIKNNWIKDDGSEIKNVDLWRELALLLSKHDITFHWVKGHADNEFNSRCDELAVYQSKLNNGLAL